MGRGGGWPWRIGALDGEVVMSCIEFKNAHVAFLYGEGWGMECLEVVDPDPHLFAYICVFFLQILIK